MKRHDNVTEQVRRIRAAVLARHGFASDGDVPGPGQPSAIEEAANLANVSAHWGIGSGVPVIGRLIVLAMRTMRIGLRWYINPIVQQQNAFNDAVVRALYELQRENDRLRAELQARDGGPAE